MFWDSCVADPRFSELLRGAGASEQALEAGRALVVRHADSTRHDLLILDPGLAEVGPRATPLNFRPAVEDLVRAPSWHGRLAQGSDEPWASLDRSTVELALAEVGTVTDFGVIVVAPPRVEPTYCPSPAWGVSTIDGAASATVGAVVVTESGTVAMTTALHAVKGAASLTVRGGRGRVISVHEPTDSCLIAVDSPIGVDVRRGRAGALHGMSPRQYDRAAFDGVASGAKATTVTAWDLSILAVQQYLGSKVYTSPDTVPGDSGAALIDSADQIIGFASYRSAFGEPIEYSAWVWADQVFGAHAVRPLGSDTVVP